MINVKSVIFDLDGTLIDSAPSILAGYSYVLELHDLIPLTPLTAALIGPPLIPTLKLLTGIEDELKLYAMCEDFKTYYDDKGCLLSHSFNGVNEGLKKLHDSGFNLHIATNKRAFPTIKILKHLGWYQLFSSIYTLDCMETVFHSKSEMLARLVTDIGLLPEKTVYIGDRSEDLDAAFSNNLAFIGVSWGYGNFPASTICVNGIKQLTDLICVHSK